MKKKYILLVAICIVLIAIILSIGAGINLINKTARKIDKDPVKAIDYSVYKYDNDTGTMLVKIQDDENGLDEIICPDGITLKCYGKTQVSIDCPINKDGQYYFKATNTIGEIIDRTIIINQETLEGLMPVQYSEENTNLTIDINYKEYKNKYYKFGESDTWIQYNGQFDILVEEAVKNNAYNEEYKTVDIYLKGTDDLENEVIVKTKIAIKAELPKVKLIIRNTDTNMDIEKMKQDIKNKLAKDNISAGFMDLALGGEEIVQSNGEDAQTIFNTWGRVGYTGRWYYDANSKSIINSENTDNYTGFYYSKKMDYNEIELEYTNTTTDSDDDIMGSMIRFNRNSNGTVTTYLFALDRHDNGGGISNGAYNGLLKITGKSFAHGNAVVLQRINRVWKRNEWTKYKIIAKENNIKVYIDDELVIDYTDNSAPILEGSYGFFSYSQAYSKYKDIKGKGLRYYSLKEAIEITDWDKETNCIININNDKEEDLTDEVALKLNENKTHYIGVTLEEHKQEIDEFLPKILNRGMYVNSTDYEKMVDNIVEYVKTIRK